MIRTWCFYQWQGRFNYHFTMACYVGLLCVVFMLICGSKLLDVLVVSNKSLWYCHVWQVLVWRVLGLLPPIYSRVLYRCVCSKQVSLYIADDTITRLASCYRHGFPASHRVFKRHEYCVDGISFHFVDSILRRYQILLIIAIFPPS